MPFSRSLYCSAVHYSLFHLGKTSITHVLLLPIDPNSYTYQTHELEAYSHTHNSQNSRDALYIHVYLTEPLSETVVKLLRLSCGSELTRFGLCKRGALHVAIGF